MTAAGNILGYARAALPLVPGASRLPFVAGGGGPMPELVRSLRTRSDRDRLAAYAKVCGFRLANELPPTWPHILAFGSHMSIMADGRFPFAPVGLVHLANRIEQLRPISISEELEIAVVTTAIEEHAKGSTFGLLTTASVEGEVVWSELSTMLRRGRAPGGEGETAQARKRDAAPPAMSARWSLGGDLGRRYAAVSGDNNPIHLSALSAKPFGFPRAIVHGMWTLARSFAALEGRLADRFVADVEFRRPILLPATVDFGSAPASSGTHFAVYDSGTGSRHMVGSVE